MFSHYVPNNTILLCNCYVLYNHIAKVYIRHILHWYITVYYCVISMCQIYMWLNNSLSDSFLQMLHMIQVWTIHLCIFKKIDFTKATQLLFLSWCRGMFRSIVLLWASIRLSDYRRWIRQIRSGSDTGRPEINRLYTILFSNRNSKVLSNPIYSFSIRKFTNNKGEGRSLHLGRISDFCHKLSFKIE